jgi:hypothetical protein
MPRRPRRNPQPDEEFAWRRNMAIAQPVDPSLTTGMDPDMDELLDREEYEGAHCVPVRIAESIRLPIEQTGCKLGGAGSLIVLGGPDFPTTQLVSNDPRRSRIWIAVTAATRIAGDQASLAQTVTCFRHIAAYGLIPFCVQDELWVRGDTTQATVTWMVEQWAQ